MREQHLSDEAIAAYADGVLARHPRERASRHTGSCAECARAVAMQREAVWALRAAPAPTLPLGLLDRLRDVPATTPIRTVPSAVGPDGSTMFSSFGSMATAALVPPQIPSRRTRAVRPFALTTAVVAVASVLVVGSGSVGASSQDRPTPDLPSVQPAHVVYPANPTNDRYGSTQLGYEVFERAR